MTDDDAVQYLREHGFGDPKWYKWYKNTPAGRVLLTLQEQVEEIKSGRTTVRYNNVIA